MESSSESDSSNSDRGKYKAFKTFMKGMKEADKKKKRKKFTKERGNYDQYFAPSSNAPPWQNYSEPGPSNVNTNPFHQNTTRWDNDDFMRQGGDFPQTRTGRGQYANQQWQNEDRRANQQWHQRPYFPSRRGRGNRANEQWQPMYQHPEGPSIRRSMNLETRRYVERETDSNITPSTYNQNRGRQPYRGHPYHRSRGRVPQGRGRGRQPSASLGRNPDLDRAQIPSNQTSHCRGCICQGKEGDHCRSCRCEEMEHEEEEEGRRNQEAQQVDQEPPRPLQTKPKSLVISVREAEKKKRKLADERGKTIIAVLGHSFITHLTARIRFISARDNVSWEEAMELGQEDVRVRYKGESGAKRDYFPEFVNYVQVNGATKALIELGTNDLMEIDDPEDIADQILEQAQAMIDQCPTLTKCMVCCIIPRTKTKDSDRWNVKTFKRRAREYNDHLKPRIHEMNNFRYWIHDRLTDPTREEMDEKGIHPAEHGLVLYMRSITRAIKALNSW
jgi:hypothetical protein